MLSLWQDPFYDFDRAFGELNREFNREVQRTKDIGIGKGAMVPRRMPVEITATKDEWHIRADLPGVPKEDVHVNIDKNVLCISAERKSEFDEKNTTWHVMERYHGSVERRFQLPDSVDTEKADAKFDDGVLKLTFKKRESDQPKKIALM